MTSIKKNAGLTTAKTVVKVSKTTNLTKSRSPYAVNFPLIKGIHPDELEITIKVTKATIMANMYIRGELVSQQALPIKKVPNPPPMPHDELFQALEQLSFNFKNQR
jgi:hypothetical protein